MDLITILTIILYSLVGIVAIIFVVIFLQQKKGKKAVKKEETDTKKFNLVNSVDFVPQDIAEIENGMLIDHTGNRFTMLIKTEGNDFALESVEEQRRIINNYIEFFNILEKPLQVYIQDKRVDIDEVLEKNREVLEKKVELYNSKMETYNTLLINLANTENEEERKMYSVEGEKMINFLVNLDWQIKHLENLYVYTKEVSTQTKISTNIKYYCISHDFDSSVFDGQLNTTEIRQRAYEALSAKANLFIQSLQKCGITSEVVSDTELLDVLRRPFRPLTCDDIKTKDFQKTNVDVLVVTKKKEEK